MIPFVRNVAEFAGMEDEEAQLTRYLHVKAGSGTLTVNDLETEFKKVIKFKADFCLPQGDRAVFDLLFRQAEAACALDEEKIELETKIVLAMAIRIKAEIYMIGVIGDQAFVDSIKSNQTFKLRQKVDTIGSASPAAIKCLKQVVLMTPENIHINSFMYEPILDMSNHHLKRLFQRVKEL